MGENPYAARTAGMNVKNIYLYAMLISGALAGVAGSAEPRLPWRPAVSCSSSPRSASAAP